MGQELWIIKSDDIRKPLLSRYKPELVELDKRISFVAGIDVDKATWKHIEGDAALAAKIWSQSGKNYKLALSEVTTLYRGFDKKHKKGWGKLNKKARQSETDKLQSNVERALKRNAHFVFKDADKQIKDWMKAKKKAGTYKIKSITKIVVGSLGVAGATLGAVTSLSGAVISGGAGAPAAAAALYGAYKAMSSLSDEIHDLARGIDKVDKTVRDELSSLLKSYSELTKNEVGGREFGKAALSQLLTIKTKSISSCSSNVSLMGNKLALMTKKSSSYGKELNKYLDAEENLVKALQYWQKLDLKDFPEKSVSGIKKNITKLEDALKKNRKHSGKLFFHLRDIMRRLGQMEKRLPVYKQLLGLLKDKKPSWLKYAVGVVKLSDLAIAVASLNVVKGVSAMDLSKIVADIKSITDELRGLATDKALG